MPSASSGEASSEKTGATRLPSRSTSASAQRGLSAAASPAIVSHTRWRLTATRGAGRLDVDLHRDLRRPLLLPALERHSIPEKTPDRAQDRKRTRLNSSHTS